MIQTSVSIDRASLQRMEKTLREFAAATGKTAEVGIDQMAKSAGKRLAATVNPYGLKGGGKMDGFVRNLGVQVSTVWFGVNIGAYPATNSMKDAHRNARVGPTMRVPARRFRKEKNNPWLDLISASDRDSHIKEIRSRAFRAKAAWVEAANSLGGAKMTGVSMRINRHLGGGYGTSTTTGEGTNYKVKLSNAVSYIGKIQKESDVARSVVEGFANGYKYMQKATKKAIEKANRNL